MRHKAISRLLLAGGLLCIAAALFLVGRNLLESARAARSAEQAAVRLEQRLIPKEEAPEQEEEPAGPALEPFLDPDSGLWVVEIEGQRYMGYLEIPALGLMLPVQSTWSYPQLKLSPCRYVGTAEENDLIIAAHNYDSHFGQLKTLEEGAEVTYTDVQGTVYSYTVAQLETLKPTAIEQMKSGEWDLTLFTCTIGGKSRVTVRCVRRDPDE